MSRSRRSQGTLCLAVGAICGTCFLLSPLWGEKRGAQRPRRRLCCCTLSQPPAGSGAAQREGEREGGRRKRPSARVAKEEQARLGGDRPPRHLQTAETADSARPLRPLSPCAQAFAGHTRRGRGRRTNNNVATMFLSVCKAACTMNWPAMYKSRAWLELPFALCPLPLSRRRPSLPLSLPHRWYVVLRSC